MKKEEKWCPFTQIIEYNNEIVSNREEYEVETLSRCITDKCACWVKQHDSIYSSEIITTGYCGLINK